jgi:heme-degrading monooxygenase HmoA
MEFPMVTRIWHGATPAHKSDEYLYLMRTVAIPDYRSIPGNKGAYALRRMEGDTAHFLMVTFWESEERSVHARATEAGPSARSHHAQS